MSYKISEKKLFIENGGKLRPLKYIQLSGMSGGRFVYSFEEPKLIGLPGIIFFPKHGIFSTSRHFSTV